MANRTTPEIRAFIKRQLADAKDFLDGIYPQETGTEYDIGSCEGAIEAYNDILQFIGEE